MSTHFTLVGRTASGFSIPVKPMTTAPPPIPVGVPSELLERRPDIAAAERTMAEANAAIGIAYAAYFPESNFERVGRIRELCVHVVAVLAEPLLVRWHIALGNHFRCRPASRYGPTICRDLQRGCAGYRQIVLTAFQQVEDGLPRFGPARRLWHGEFGVLRCVSCDPEVIWQRLLAVDFRQRSAAIS